jgi:alpha-tubulin suppressor-like RCC1 family protein
MKKVKMTASTTPPGQDIEEIGPAPYPPPPSGHQSTDWNGIIAAGDCHSAVLNLTDGSVSTFGSGKYGQLGTGRVGTNEYIPTRIEIPDGGAAYIAAGTNQTVAITRGGRVFDFGLSAPYDGISGVVSISCGFDYMVTVLADGRVRVYDIYPTLKQRNWNFLATATSVTAAAAGWRHALFLLADGRVAGWGWNDNYQIGEFCGNFVQALVINLVNVVQIAAGATHSAAVTAQGHVAIWGTRRLVDGNEVISKSPVFISSINDAVNVACGLNDTVILHRDGRVSAFGVDGTLEYFGGITDAIAVSCGTYHTMILHADGRVSTVGYNGTGQLGCGEHVETLTSPTYIRLPGEDSLTLD